MSSVIRVLLVDDEPDVLEELSDSLSYQRTLIYRLDVIAVSTNGEEALALAVQLQPDLIILDLEMPGMDGLQTAQALYREVPSAKIIILSGHHDRIDMYSALAAHIRGYVLKSRSQTLLSAIDEVVHGEHWFDPLVFHHMYGKSLRGEGQRWMRTLSSREQEVLGLFQQGFTQAAIAQQLQIGAETVKSHLANIRSKAGCANLSELKLKLPR